jgi:hypothetical protein
MSGVSSYFPIKKADETALFLGIALYQMACALSIDTNIFLIGREYGCRL